MGFSSMVSWHPKTDGSQGVVRFILLDAASRQLYPCPKYIHLRMAPTPFFLSLPTVARGGELDMAAQPNHMMEGSWSGKCSLDLRCKASTVRFSAESVLQRPSFNLHFIYLFILTTWHVYHRQWSHSPLSALFSLPSTPVHSLCRQIKT